MKVFGVILMLVSGVCDIEAQSYHEYNFIFSGTAYETGAAGVIVATHMTEQTLLKDRARQGNVTNLNTVSLVYHTGGNPLGDTIVVIANATGQTLATVLSFYFGSDSAYGRIEVTNLLQTQERRVDYIYTFDNSTYTFSNPASVGAAFTYKSCVKDGKATNAVINGTMSWDVIPTGPNTRPIVCIGAFSLGRPMF